LCDKKKDGTDFDVNGVARANNYRVKIVDAPHYGVVVGIDDSVCVTPSRFVVFFRTLLRHSLFGVGYVHFLILNFTFFLSLGVMYAKARIRAKFATKVPGLFRSLSIVYLTHEPWCTTCSPWLQPSYINIEKCGFWGKF
jgi:hypothetical protein